MAMEGIGAQNHSITNAATFTRSPRRHPLVGADALSLTQAKPRSYLCRRLR